MLDFLNEHLRIGLHSAHMPDVEGVVLLPHVDIADEVIAVVDDVAVELGCGELLWLLRHEHEENRQLIAIGPFHWTRLVGDIHVGQVSFAVVLIRLGRKRVVALDRFRFLSFGSVFLIPPHGVHFCDVVIVRGDYHDIRCHHWHLKSVLVLNEDDFVVVLKSFYDSAPYITEETDTVAYFHFF